MLRLEGNPWTYGFNRTVPMVNSASKVVVGKDLLSKFPFTFKDTYNNFHIIEGDFSHSKSSLKKDGSTWDF